MNSGDLSREQVEQMKRSLSRLSRYLHRVLTRMDANSFPFDDPLYRKVKRADDAVGALWIDLHYRSCGSGCGMSPRHSSKRELRVEKPEPRRPRDSG